MAGCTTQRSSSVQSVDRAVSILESIARHRAVGLTSLANELGLNKTTAFRLLATLMARGLVEQTEERGDYRLGYTAWLLAGAAEKPDVVAACRQLVLSLAAETKETVNVAVACQGEVVTVDQFAGTAGVAGIDWIGRRGPLHATAAGKVLLAFSTREEVNSSRGADLERFTEFTITDPAELQVQLERVCETGLAYVHEEHEVGLVAVAAPVRRLDGVTVAAMTVSGPAYRLDKVVLPRVAAAVSDAASRASWRFGWPKV